MKRQTLSSQQLTIWNIILKSKKMAQEEKFVHKASSGSLFKNDYKEKETHPDYTGSCTDPNGNVYDLAGWVSKTKDGKSYFSLKIEHPFEKKEEANTTPEPTPVNHDLPF